MTKRAIIFTEDTTNLLPLAKCLVQSGWELVSGGETAEFLEKNAIPVAKKISIKITPKANDDFTSILHSIINTNIQNIENIFTSDENTDVITPLVCVNITPRWTNLNKKNEISPISNKIDYEHISLIRAAAKNYANVLILTDPSDYQEAIKGLRTGHFPNDDRLALAAKALNLTAAYDAGISISLLYDPSKPQFPPYFVAPYKKTEQINYGANAHQDACLYTLTGVQSASSGFRTIQGNDLDFRSMKNSLTAWNVVSMFLKLLKRAFEIPSIYYSAKSSKNDKTDSSNKTDKIEYVKYPYSTQLFPATNFVFTIGIKLCTPIGAAFGPDVATSFSKTVNCAPESFDGAVIGCSAVIDEKAAAEIIKTNVSTVIAPGFAKEAREILSEKESIRLIIATNPVTTNFEGFTIDGGFLTQISDCILFKHFHTVTEKHPSQAQIDAMALGTMISIATKSNSAIIINDNTAIGISSGQTNWKKTLSLAIDDAQECFKNNLTSSDTNAEVLVSDDSIPFGDFIYRLPEIGVKAIMQPGGSPTDEAFIAFCNEHKISMIFTGMTHLNF